MCLTTELSHKVVPRNRILLEKFSLPHLLKAFPAS